MAQEMSKVGEGKRQSDLGYKYTVSIYQAQNCQGCPLRGQCNKGKQNRKKRSTTT
jgi:hypothetical protein